MNSSFTGMFKSFDLLRKTIFVNLLSLWALIALHTCMLNGGSFCSRPSLIQPCVLDDWQRFAATVNTSEPHRQHSRHEWPVRSAALTAACYTASYPPAPFVCHTITCMHTMCREQTVLAVLIHTICIYLNAVVYCTGLSSHQRWHINGKKEWCVRPRIHCLMLLALVCLSCVSFFITVLVMQYNTNVWCAPCDLNTTATLSCNPLKCAILNMGVQQRFTS